ncbi:ADP-ribosylation factor-like protein 5 [Hondaea fermentalgiana]|uniref:ADP-ribosylation factor-like protein 5 n=1 Tax=Hondaea fermentalgiana TaxID=2315210 RepID=A0A2R5G3G4_9STRA|nr:ADP-ribosylation factor-like protein 5 [Hondaea fermentalgiana]|eukprot:GBG25577.1 ADP-ribosylation factor-like protein 5 [Hondaea fermentalgiana]
MGAARSRYSVVLVGLDGAGKTTFLFNLAAKPSDSSPTVVVSLHQDKSSLSHRARLPEAKVELHKVLHEVDLLDAEVIILDNIKRTSSQVRTATQQHRSDVDPSDSTSRNLPRTNIEPLKESDIRYEMDVPRDVSVLEVNANEPAELGRLMHQICQQLIK